MQNIEKLFLLGLLYESSDNAQILDQLYKDTILENDKIIEIKKSLEEDIFLGSNGKNLLEKGKKAFANVFSSPSNISEMDVLLNDYLYARQANALTIEKMVTYVNVPVDEYAVISTEECKDMIKYFEEYYIQVLYSALVFGGQKGIECVPEFKGGDIYNWLAYFYKYLPYRQKNKQNTWVIYFRNFSNASNFSNYEIVYYEGQAKYDSLIREAGAIQYGTYVWGNSSGVEKTGRTLVAFGMGNITNIKNVNADIVFKKDIYFQLPAKKNMPIKELDMNPYINLEKFFQEKDVLYCIEPQQYVSLCRAVLENKKRRNGSKMRFCPICGSSLSNGYLVCQRHGGLQ